MCEIPLVRVFELVMQMTLPVVMGAEADRNEAGERSLWIKDTPCKCEGLGSDFQNPCKTGHTSLSL